MNRLFVERQRDDLLVLYFSGHGVVDDFGNFYFTTAHTELAFLDATAIPASFVLGLLEQRGKNRSERQVLILDCCNSGAFAKGMSAKGPAVNLQAQLGGRGRAVLTSSSATEYSFEQKEASLSVYTQYVVEGLRTGIADQNGDGMISVDELHEFARAKVQDVAPAMQPKIYAAEQGYKIVVAKAPVGDPKLEYRKEVEKLADQRQGKFSAPILMALEIKQQQLGLASEVAVLIRQEVLRPYEEFAAKIQKYHQVLQQELQPGNQLSSEAWKDLQYLQKTLGLTDENIQPLVEQVRISSVQTVPPRTTKSWVANSTETSNQSSRVATSARARTQAEIQKKIHSMSKWLIFVASFGLSLGGFWVIGQNSQSRPGASPPINVPNPVNTASTAEDLVEKGLEKYEKKNYKGAIDDYDQAIKLKPDYSAAYNNRGIARRDLGDNKAAITDFDQAIQTNRNWRKGGLWTAYNNRGIARRDLGDNKAAIDDFDQAIKLKPDLAEAYNSRGDARSALGDNKAAIDDYDQAIRLKPDYTDAYFNRGTVRSALGDKKAAINDYDQAIKLKPDYTDAYFNRGNALRDLGDNKAAIDDYDQAIKLKPDYAKAYNNRGIARSDLGDNKAAITDYDQVIKLKPDFAEAYINRGIARSDLGDNKAAIDDYDQAIKLKPDFATAYSGRGIARSDLGDKKAAIDDYDQAIKLKPDYALAYYNRGIARNALGDKQSAILDYQKAAELYKTQNKTQDYQDALNRIKKLQQ